MKWRKYLTASTTLVAVAASASVQAQSGERQPVDAERAVEPPSDALRNRADRSVARNRRWSLTGAISRETQTRLPLFPYKAITAQLPFRDAYAASIAVNRTVAPRFTIPLPGFELRGNSLELEVQALQHWGLERSTEVDAAAVLRSGQFGVVGRTSANVAWGNGFSYALTRPTLELGPSGRRGVDTIRLQYHMSFETELTSGAATHVHLVVRLHHRSGIYGLISPSRTGSNYLGTGVRVDLR